MHIPKVDDWIDCFGKESLGKVFNVDLEKQTCIAGFFTEWSKQEDVGGIAEESISFPEIKGIITDEKMISDLEKELAGEVNFED